VRSHGVLATLRQSAGQDVEGGCGQSRAILLLTDAPRTEVVRFAKGVALD